jgi:Endonuclease NucS C-terminal domain
LEDLLAHDPTLVGEPLLLVGRQVPTVYGGSIDLLAVDGEGYLCVLELKRDRTPREVVAQLLDYASWLAEGIPDLDAVSALHAMFDDSGQDFTDAFEQLFGDRPPDDISGANHRLIVVAGKLDGATERIVNYLSGYDVPINAVLFQYFEDGENKYLARTWVREDDAPTAIRAAKNRPAWNGLDWYVSFGEDSGRRNWEDARTYGFVSAGGGLWYTRTLRALPVGARIWTYIPGTGYVGVGEVVGQATPAETPRSMSTASGARSSA